VRVFDGDSRIVDQYTDRQSKAAERHDVDGFAKKGEDRKRGQDREWDRDEDDQGRTP
jgi:hypothetical protein